jgi:uncharacterized membrane protein YhaH (DUF805 family)
MAEIDWMHLFFQFDGRINRAKFWLGVVIIWIVDLVVLALFGRGDSRFTVAAIIGLLLIWPSLAVYVKRFHDRDKSGWWVLIALIPIIGFIWIIIELGILEGTDGPNQFGPDPLGRGIADDMAM